LQASSTRQSLINADFVDPLYEQWRKLTRLSASNARNCTDLPCDLVDGKPYTEEDYDLNLTKIDAEYYNLEVASAKGQTLLELMQKELKINRSTEEDLRAVRETRRAVEKKLQLQNKAFERDGDYQFLRTADLTKWVDEAANCCGCGGCTHICPTCYCMILNDETTVKLNKERSVIPARCMVMPAWLAALRRGRPKMFERFRNRYLCKLSYMQSNFGMLGCTAAGVALRFVPQD
jgi:ferredoxin